MRIGRYFGKERRKKLSKFVQIDRVMSREFVICLSSEFAGVVRLASVDSDASIHDVLVPVLVPRWDLCLITETREASALGRFRLCHGLDHPVVEFSHDIDFIRLGFVGYDKLAARSIRLRDQLLQ